MFMTNKLLEDYYIILVFMAVAALVSLIPVTLSFFRARQKPNDEKTSPYECGFSPFSDTRKFFDVRFYLVAILFVIFDLEIAFLFPWAIFFNKMAPLGVFSMLIFLGVLGAGFVYEWKKGALDWE